MRPPVRLIDSAQSLRFLLLSRQRSVSPYCSYRPIGHQAGGAGYSFLWAALKGIGQPICCSAALTRKRFADLGAGPCSQCWQDSAG